MKSSKLMFVLVGFFILFFTIFSPVNVLAAESFENIFQAKQLIHINPSPDGTLTDFQYKITINHQSSMSSDFSDIRFATVTGENVPYWVESKTEGVSADVWLNLPVVDSVDGLDVWMYYGNTEIGSGSEGDAVFDFFDDAESGAFADKWINVIGSGGSYSTVDKYSGTNSIRVVGDDAIIASITVADDAVFEAKVKSTGVNSTFNLLNARASKTSHTYYGFRPHYVPSSGNSQLIKRVNGAWTVLNDSSSQGSSETIWADWKIVADGSSIKTYFNDLLLNSATDSFLTSGSIGSRSAGTTSPIYLDEVKIRKHTDNLPTYTTSSPVALDWQLADWSYRKHIDVVGSPDGDLIDFQIILDINFESEMNSDFSDLRFKTFDGTDVPYWVESKTNDSTAKVWLKLPLISSENGAGMWMYYGNSDANSLSDPESVFDLFDDFNDSILDVSKWAIVGSSGSRTFANSEMTVRPTTAYKVPYGIRSLGTFSSGTVVETKGRNTANRHVTMVGLADSPWMQFPHGDTVTDGFAMYSRVDGSDYVSASFGYGSNTGYGPVYSNNTSYYIWKIEFVSPVLVKFYRDNELKYTLTNPVYITPNLLNAYLTGDNYMGKGTVVVYDWIRVYKITTNQPTLSIGTQEQGTTPLVTGISFNQTTPELGNPLIATATATDPQGFGNISSYSFTIKNPSGTVFEGPVTQASNEYSFIPDSAGEWVVEVTATDAEANTSSVFSKTIDVSGWWDSNWSYRKTITVTDTSGSELVDFQVPVDLTTALYDNNGLVGSWHFSEGTGTKLRDSSENNNDGILINNPVWTTGKFGNGLQFDGVDDYVDTQLKMNSSDEFTLMGWALVQNKETMASFVGNNDSNNRAYIGLRNGKYWFGIGNTQKYGISADAINNNEWFYWTLVAKDGVGKYYLNGVEVDTVSYIGQGQQNYPMVIGGIKESGVIYPAFVNGKIDEVKIYNRALTEIEIQDHFNATKGNLDYSDLRFADISGIQELSYWVENDSKVWIKVPSVPANGSTDIFMYYGNPFVESTSNAKETYELFDEFDFFDSLYWDVTDSQYSVSGGVLTLNTPFLNQIDSGLSSKNTVSGKSITEMRVAFIGSNNNAAAGLSGHKSGIMRNNSYMMYHWENGLVFITYSENGVENQRDYVTKSQSFVTYEFVNDGANIEYFYNGVSQGTLTTLPEMNGNMYFRVAGYIPGSYDGPINVDYVKIRKYASSLPTISFGTQIQVSSPTVTGVSLNK